MIKTKITVDFNSEKVEALRMYLPNKGLNIESELEKTLVNLYEKHVPTQVREFIYLKEEKSTKGKKKGASGFGLNYDNSSNEDMDLPFDI